MGATSVTGVGGPQFVYVPTPFNSSCGSTWNHCSNQCDPNAPEHGKAWKPRNNAGCIQCHANCDPLPCDCNRDQPTPTPARRGCYTSMRTGITRTYSATRGGNSMRVC